MLIRPYKKYQSESIYKYRYLRIDMPLSLFDQVKLMRGSEWTREPLYSEYWMEPIISRVDLDANGQQSLTLYLTVNNKPYTATITRNTLLKHQDYCQDLDIESLYRFLLVKKREEHIRQCLTVEDGCLYIKFGQLDSSMLGLKIRVSLKSVIKESSRVPHSQNGSSYEMSALRGEVSNLKDRIKRLEHLTRDQQTNQSRLKQQKTQKTKNNELSEMLLKQNAMLRQSVKPSPEGYSIDVVRRSPSQNPSSEGVQRLKQITQSTHSRKS